METLIQYAQDSRNGYLYCFAGFIYTKQGDVDADIKTMMSKITKPYLDYRVNETKQLYFKDV